MINKKILNKIRRLERLQHFLVGFLLFFGGLSLVAIFFALGEEYQLLVAGTDTDSVVISVVVTESISINSPVDISLNPEITETGSATGDVTWNIETNNSDGWKMELNASASPALVKDADSFADYTEATPGTPESWSITADASEFGFSAGGTYAESEYSNGALFEGFEGTTKILVAQDNEASPGGGADTQINFRAEVGGSKSQPSGTYQATITATASTL